MIRTLTQTILLPYAAVQNSYFNYFMNLPFLNVFRQIPTKPVLEEEAKLEMMEKNVKMLRNLKILKDVIKKIIQ